LNGHGILEILQNAISVQSAVFSGLQRVADGNEDAIVCALDMTPNQLRIADYITTSPTDHKRRDIHPEAAFIRDGQIVVESWRY
jgi:hypothetical protein